MLVFLMYSGLIAATVTDDIQVSDGFTLLCFHCM